MTNSFSTVINFNWQIAESGAGEDGEKQAVALRGTALGRRHAGLGRRRKETKDATSPDLASAHEAETDGEQSSLFLIHSPVAPPVTSRPLLGAPATLHIG